MTTTTVVFCRNFHPEVGGTKCIAVIHNGTTYNAVEKVIWLELVQGNTVFYDMCETCKKEAK